MVLSYLRWEADVAASFGLVASPTCGGVVFLKTAGLAVAGAGESVAVWHIKQGVVVARLVPDGHEYAGVGARVRAQVTQLIAHPLQSDVVAAGYSDGAIRLWNLTSRREVVALQGHRGVISALCFSEDGSRLYSGGADTDIVAWDVVAESGLFRLRGHKAPVTSLALLESTADGAEHNHLISASKDTLVKVWDLATQAAVQTVVGHRVEVTALAANPKESVLVTGAAEGPLRVWHIHPTGRADNAEQAQAEKKISVKLEPGVAAPAAAAASAPVASSSALFTAAEGSVELLRFWGFLPRDSQRRVTGLSFWPARAADPTLLLVQSADKQVDLFHVRSHAEVEKKVKRRIKRQREKAKKHAGAEGKKGAAAAAPSVLAGPAAATAAAPKAEELVDVSDAAVDAANGASTQAIPIDQFQSLLPLRTSVKVVACAASSSAAHLRLLLSMSDNSMQVWSIDLAAARISMDEREEKDAPVPAAGLLCPHYSQLYSLSAAGHRTGIRVVALNPDSSALMTASGEQIKIWNLVSRQCIRTIDAGYALCGFFVPGSRHVLIGTKAGEIELYDLSTGSCLQKVAAHGAAPDADGNVRPGATSPVYALDLRPDQKGFTSGGGDKEVKVWDFELVLTKQDEEFVHTKTLKLTDDVLCLRNSPDGKLLAVGLLDSTIKIFYADSLKFFLSLYGHKLPVLSIDISSDSNLLLSGSADKNVKLWGLDFGDCHKSLFGHQDSITSVRFIRGTHQFFTAGKDKVLKLWDGDTFEQVQLLEGHTAEVWAVAINQHGNTVVTAGNDKCIRVFKQTDQQLFLEEERESRLEKIYDEGATVEAKGLGEMAGSGLVAPGESALVARTNANQDSLKAGERLIEAIELADADRERWLRYEAAVRDQAEEAAGRKNGEKLTGLQLIAAQQKKAEVLAVPQTNPLIRGPNADAHVLHCLQSIKTPELDEALLVLPFDFACRLLPYLNRSVSAGAAVELCTHALLFLLQAHHKQLVSNQVMLDTLRDSRDTVRRQLRAIKHSVGFNLAALAFVGRQAKDQQAQWTFGEKEAAKDDDAAAAAGNSKSNSNSNSKPAAEGEPNKKKRRM